MIGAAARAVVQLSAVALVVAWVFEHPAGAVAYLAVMLAAATATSVRRIGEGIAVLPQVLLSIVAGSAATVAVVAGTSALPFTSRTMLPFAAQIIGGTMTAVSLAASRLYDYVAGQWAVVESWLVLGATPAESVRDLGRRSAARALIPALDQTRSAGLVVLPGAFVGMLLGGASPRPRPRRSSCWPCSGCWRPSRSPSCWSPGCSGRSRPGSSRSTGDRVGADA